MSLPRSRRWRFALAVLALLGLALALDAFWIEPSSLRLRRYELALQRWPAALAGLKIAVITDLHAGAPYIGLAKIEHVVALSNAAQPDLVLLTGDIFVNSVIGGQALPPEQVARRLGALQARLGVYLVFGNHEHHTDRQNLQRLLAATPIQFMDNAVRRIDDRGSAFWLIGLADILSDRPDVSGTLAQVTDEAPIIAFTHGPDLFPTLPARVNLLVAGHTHGGQVRLPILGAGRVPSIYGRRRYAAGHVVEQTDLFVATGIGTSHIPVRFGVPPEIALLSLRQAGAP
ncbi:MAG: metallophosphoesterase [Nevskia sp.]